MGVPEKVEQVNKSKTNAGHVAFPTSKMEAYAAHERKWAIDKKRKSYLSLKSVPHSYSIL